MKCPYCGFDFPPPKVKETIEVVLERLEKENFRLFKQYEKFIAIEKIQNEKGYKLGWVFHKLKTIEDFKDFEKYKNYRYGWANRQIEQRKIKE